MSAREEVLAALRDLGISYHLLEHEAVFHMEDCEGIAEPEGAVYCKNAFLTTKSRRIYALCVMRPEARFQTSDVSHQAGTPRLSFADEAAMEALLGTYPGAVSPLGLLFDREGRVRLLVDEELRTVPRLAFHPCDNRATVLLDAKDFFDIFLPAIRHAPQFVTIHDPAEN